MKIVCQLSLRIFEVFEVVRHVSSRFFSSRDRGEKASGKYFHQSLHVFEVFDDQNAPYYIVRGSCRGFHNYTRKKREYGMHLLIPFMRARDGWPLNE